MAMLLKNVFNEHFVSELASQIAARRKGFSSARFTKAVFSEQWPTLELKERMRHISTTLGSMLECDYRSALHVLMDVAPGFKGLPAMVFPDFVQVYGLDDVEPSLKALAHFTPLFSSEFAIRPFLERYGKVVERQMGDWSKNEDHHIRRLSSEGMRPRLPWAPPLRAYIANPSPIMPILERLKSDSSDYVRTSVANNINDISKDHPQLVLQLVRRWSKHADVPEDLLRKASRTMLRRGDVEFLDVFQEQPNAKLVCYDLAATPRRIAIGEAAELRTAVTNTGTAETNLRLEFAIAFIKADGRASRKVFAWRRDKLAAGEKRAFLRRFRFAHYTTRRQYPGKHVVEVVVNGEVRAVADVHIV
jgi:3-methyladenine DNA glycosylase AlkC